MPRISGKVECAYTKYFFEQMRIEMLKREVNSILDASNTLWFMADVEQILIDNYGYRRTAGGGLL